MRKKLRKVNKKIVRKSKWQPAFDHLEDNLKWPKIERVNEEIKFSLWSPIFSTLVNWIKNCLFIFLYCSIYLFLIWGFSKLYEANASEFYYPNLERDPAYLEEIKLFRTRFKDRLIHHLNYTYNTTEFEVDGFSVDFSNMSIATVRPLHEGIEVMFRGSMRRKIGKISRPLRYRHTMLLHNGCMNHGAEVINSYSDYKQFDKILEQFPITVMDTVKLKSYLLLYDDLCDQVFHLCMTKANKPSLIPKNLGNRMLYYSASTMTGLGLGDILPMTDRMRFWSIAQTILGLLTIGFFLNSLARRYTKPS